MENANYQLSGDAVWYFLMDNGIVNGAYMRAEDIAALMQATYSDVLHALEKLNKENEVQVEYLYNIEDNSNDIIVTIPKQ